MGEDAADRAAGGGEAAVQFVPEDRVGRLRAVGEGRRGVPPLARGIAEAEPALPVHRRADRHHPAVVREPVERRAGEAGDGPAAPLLVPHGEDHPAAPQGEGAGGGEAGATGGPGDDVDAAAEVGDGVGGPVPGARTTRAAQAAPRVTRCQA
ncbi:hypothetical protein GCM10010363_62170 [Streptomyces omiyaensis]|nr:hypothetical protein GCM10010363_62170 [Streptomyces omiyaensis]